MPELTSPRSLTRGHWLFKHRDPPKRLLEGYELLDICEPAQLQEVVICEPTCQSCGHAHLLLHPAVHDLFLTLPAFFL